LASGFSLAVFWALEAINGLVNGGEFIGLERQYHERYQKDA